MVRAEDYRGSQSMNIKSLAGEYGPRDAKRKEPRKDSPQRARVSALAVTMTLGALPGEVSRPSAMLSKRPGRYAPFVRNVSFTDQYTNQRHGLRLVAGGRSW